MSLSLKYVWTYEKLGLFTYNLLSDEQIKPFLLEHIMAEWRIDATENPDQIWTHEWMAALPRMRGYTRYLVFTRQGQESTYAYVGTVE